MAAIDHVGFADKLIDSTGTVRMCAKAIIRPSVRIVALQIGERMVVHRDDELIHGGMFEIFTHKGVLFVRIAPPLRHVRLREPAPYQRQVRH